MKGEILFEKMTGISDEYVMEAALVAPVTAESGKKRRVASLSTAWRRGLSAACICLIVAITAVGGLVAWEPIRDFIEQGNHPSGQYTFYYQTDSMDGKHCVAMPGDTVSVDTGLQNEGKAFEASNFFARAYFVLQSDPSVVLEGEPYPLNEDAHAAVRTIKSGYRENMPFTFIIPEDAVFGVYDLVLSYGEEQQVYKGVLTVGEVETEGETYPPEDTIDRYGFSFEYEVLNTYDPAYAAWRAGDTIRIQVSVTNQGASFEYEGSSGDFIPHAVLSLTTADDPRQTLQVYGLDIPLPDDHGVFTVAEGETGTAVYEFVLPNDIPAGTLYLTMSYDGQETGNTRVGNVSDATYTMEEAIAFAKELLAVQYPEIDLSGYAIRCVDSLGAGLHYRVQFSYLYYGYTVGGGDMIDVSLTADKRLAEIEMTDEYGEHTAYLTQEVFLTAAQHIRDGIALADPSVDPDEIMNQLLYFHIDKEGYFCLALEHIGPPILDENGNSLSGCGDHEHYFFSERLYITP